MSEKYLLADGKHITGTLVWYYSLCKREVWLMGHEITPDEDFHSLEMGRVVHQIFFKGFRKELALEGVKFDFLKRRENIVCEIKTSSRFLDATILQLAYYLYRLRAYGVEATGEIRVPMERKRIEITLDKELEARLLYALSEIREILKSTKPPEPVKTRFCKRCAYKDFCWG